MMLFQFTQGPAGEKGERFAGIASAYGGQGVKELKAAGIDARQANPPEYRVHRVQGR
jgi:hypothetical protein